MDDIERCARLLGMKRSEVLEVVPDADGELVRTHDGQWTLIRDDGTLRPGSAPEVTLERDSGVTELATGGIVTSPVFVGKRGPEEVIVREVKIVPKRRGRS